MASKPRTPQRLRTAAYAFTGLLLLAVLTPVVMGASERDDERRKDSERAAEHRQDGERADARGPHRAPKGNITAFTFSADGKDRDNNTYDLSGAGQLGCRSRDNETTGLMQVVCRGRVNATVTDANGTVLKSGEVFVILHAHKNETGAWKWHVMSLGHGKRGNVILALHGDSATQEGDQLSLGDGKGVVMVKKQDERARLKLRLSEGDAVIAKA